MKTRIVCFPSKRQISAIAMEWFPENHKLDMKVLKCNNVISPLSFYFRSDFKSFTDYIGLLSMMRHIYDCLEILKSLLDDQKRIFCGGLSKMIKWKWRVWSAIGRVAIQLFPCFFSFRSVYKSFIDLYILKFMKIEQVYDCAEVLKSLSDDQKQKFCHGHLE